MDQSHLMIDLEWKSVVFRRERSTTTHEHRGFHRACLKYMKCTYEIPAYTVQFSMHKRKPNMVNEILIENNTLFIYRIRMHHLKINDEN